MLCPNKRVRYSLIRADVFQPELVRWPIEMLSEGLHSRYVAAYGTLRVVSTLEFLQHYFA